MIRVPGAVPRGPVTRNALPAGPGRAARGVAAALLLAFAVAGATGCAPREAETEATRAARAQALIESGNAAYRQGDYRLAVRRYAAASVERKDDPAAYYGLGMALSKLGRDEEARAAYARARGLAQSPSPAGGDASRRGHP
jgi:tetratricopeptide (TPR) repeat protein